MVTNKIRYHAQRGWHSLRKRLGLMTEWEYNVKKHLIRDRHAEARPSDSSIVAHDMGRLWRNFDPYFTDNMQALPGKYLRLIEGMDEESCRTVQVALSRLMKLHANGWRKTRFEATVYEALEIKRLRDELDARVICFPGPAGGRWAYRGWLLPHRELEPGPILHRAFIGELGALQSIRHRDILDVGGYVGDTALVFSDYTDKKVYTFEPSPRHMEIMLETLRMNDSSKIVPVPLGLGDREEGMFMPDAVSGAAGFTSKGLPVRVTTLDEWAKGNDVDVGLIKVDIEGFEQRFLRGAVETIKKHRPAMLLSIYHTASDLFDIKPFIENLDLGYRFKVRRPADRRSIITDTTLVCEASGPVVS